MKLSKLFPQISTENKIQTSKARGNAAVPQESSTGGGADRVQLSAGSRDVQKMQEILQQTPDTRVEMVQALKERIERNEYQVEPQQVADKMLQSMLSEDITNI